MKAETVFVKHPMSGEILELPFPSVAIFGSEENCVIMLLTNRDPAKCGIFRGNLNNEPELREELFNSKRKLIHWDEDNNKPQVIN